VKGLGEECSLATETVKGCCKLELGDGKGMAEMQHAVHVGIWEVSEKLAFRHRLAALRCIHLKELPLGPASLCCMLNCEELVSAGVRRRFVHGGLFALFLQAAMPFHAEMWFSW
jgi:hypothetical protein